MKSTPSVSYVVTLFNKERFIDHLLTGLATQEGAFERQFIFVDDGSTDQTVNMLRNRTAGWSNVVILQQKNSGPAIASNHGFTAATGDFIKAMDGDDVLLPWATEYLLRAIQENAADVAYLSGNSQGFYRAGDAPRCVAHEKAPFAYEVEIDPLLLSMKRSRMNPSMWLARSDLIKRIGGCDEGVFIQDYSIELRLMEASKVVRVDTLGACFPEAAAGRLSENAAQILHDVNLALVRFLQDRPALPKKLARYALKRAGTRAWSWANRHGGKSVFSSECALHLAAQFGMVSLTPDIAERLCRPFRQTNAIRLAERAGRTDAFCG